MQFTVPVINRKVYIPGSSSTRSKPQAIQLSELAKVFLRTHTIIPLQTLRQEWRIRPCTWHKNPFRSSGSLLKSLVRAPAFDPDRLQICIQQQLKWLLPSCDVVEFVNLQETKFDAVA